MASYEAHAAGREHDLVLLFKGFPAPADAGPYLERAARQQSASAASWTTRASTSRPTSPRPSGLSHRLRRLRELVQRDSRERLAGAALRAGGGRRRRGRRHRVVGRRPVLQALSGGGAGRLRGRLRRTGGPCASPCTRSTGRPIAATWSTGSATSSTSLRDFPLLSLFPAVHLRTNAFVIERELFLSLRTGRLRTKRAVYQLESGRGNLTAQLTARGRPPVVVDPHGAARRGPEWPEGDVFWQGRQQDLLVADNQTRRTRTACAAIATCSAASPGDWRRGPDSVGLRVDASAQVDRLSQPDAAVEGRLGGSGLRREPCRRAPAGEASLAARRGRAR